MNGLFAVLIVSLVTLACTSSGEGDVSNPTFPPAFESDAGKATDAALQATFSRHSQGKSLAQFRKEHERKATFASSRGSNVRLAWARYAHPRPKGEVVFTTGLTDSFSRNLETIHDLHAAGYTVLAFDHRGQGASSRLAPRREVVHVDAFTDYVLDLETFVTKVVPRAPGTQRYFFAPSMGGAVGAIHNASHPEAFDAAVYVVPMFGINLRIPGGAFFARPIVATLSAFGRERESLPGGKDWAPTPFDTSKNIFTSDAGRHDFFMDFLTGAPDLRHGSSSVGWIGAALLATSALERRYAEHRMPALVFTAQKDELVREDAHEAFCRIASPCKRVFLPGAKHDALNEVDATRNTILKESTAFFAQQRGTPAGATGAEAPAAVPYSAK